MESINVRSAILRLGGLGLAQLIDTWMGTVEFRAHYQDMRADPVHPDPLPAAIYILWHEYIMTPFFLRPNANFAMLLSQHRDAEWLTRAAHLRGFETIRGSTNRGGVAALRNMFQRQSSVRIAITPDGPRGPRRQLAPGCIYIASKLQLPIIVAGIGYDRPWRIRKAWDQFAIPRPCSRARVVFGEPIYVPEELSREGMTDWQQYVERELNTVTQHAEDWACDHYEREGSHALYRSAVRRSKSE